ncbi:VOC family protein [Streptomyces sp. NBC_01718]|uniref:VOC family protein n=1 Tax=unclassified Streptomyces TaxID=2593676 RepID=UPI00352D346E
MTSLVRHMTFDCADAYKLGSFWAEVLGSRPSPGAALLFASVKEAAVRPPAE